LIGATTDFYATNWPNNSEFYLVENNGNTVFNGSIDVGDDGPGTIVAVGEVNHSGLPMEGYFHRVAAHVEQFNLG
jgi:hypothetical protein